MKDRNEERQLSLHFEESNSGDGHTDCLGACVATRERLFSAKVYTFSGVLRQAALTHGQQDESQSLVQRALTRVKLF